MSLLNNFSLKTTEKLKLKDIFLDRPLVVLDLETSGLSPSVHEIIEIAAIKISPTEKYELFHSLIKPKTPLTQENMLIHGISNQDLENSPSLQSVFPKFLDFIQSFPLLAHNAQFDIGFLAFDSFQLNLPLKNNDVFDSFLFAKSILKKNKEKKLQNFKLSGLADFYSISFNHHRAIDDSEACLKIFSQLLLHPQCHVNSYDKLKNSKAFLFNLENIPLTSEHMAPTSPELEQLQKAILKRKDVHISYKAGSKGKALRPIRPISLLNLPQGVTLYSLCLQDNIHKNFQVKKIQKVIINE